MSKTFSKEKSDGVHYTPEILAKFLAKQTVAYKQNWSGPIDVLDPACGDGALLRAFVEAVPTRVRKRLRIFGYESDPIAVERANQDLHDLGVQEICIGVQDFLEVEGIENGDHSPASLFGNAPPEQRFHAIIANPPYVRTQVLGADKSQRLCRKFGLSGRTDLYHAFVVGMANSLHAGGVLGLLTSNRFLTTRAGLRLRQFLMTNFTLDQVIDLGDTKLFSAAVLPAIVIGHKGINADSHSVSKFSRAYATRIDSEHTVAYPHVLEALDCSDFCGVARTPEGDFKVEKGLLVNSGPEEVWSLSTTTSAAFLRTVKENTAYTFDEVAKIRVGIKTTADSVFIRKEWDSLEPEDRPEATLIHPLLTHQIAGRWQIAKQPIRSVLYPHVSVNGKKSAVSLADYPKTARYFDRHSKRLKDRKYVVESGRAWYEIWVPHRPDDWARRKVVFPDISEEPTFYLDETAAIVNGDCYWIVTRDEFDDDWLILLLAVANSDFIKTFYDTSFHNKLYAGRRRFMTQYVKQFPLPDINTKTARKIVAKTKDILSNVGDLAKTGASINQLVLQAFGVA